MRSARSLTVSRSIWGEESLPNPPGCRSPGGRAPTPDANIPSETDTPLEADSKPREQTERSKNITLSETSFAGGNKKAQVSSLFGRICH